MGVITDHPQGMEFNEQGTPTATPLGALWWQRGAKKIAGCDGHIWGTTILAPPVITSPTTANGVGGSYFAYQTTATNYPTSWNATSLPAGLTVNTSTGLIDGILVGPGISSITLSANNAAGTGTGPLSLTVMAPPVITSATTGTATIGVYYSYQITATNSPTSWNATGLPAGLTVNTGTGLIDGTPTGSGVANITLSATNAGGTGTGPLTLTVAQAVYNNVLTGGIADDNSHVAGRDASMALDGNPLTAWHAVGYDPVPYWWRYNLGSGNSKIFRRMAIMGEWRPDTLILQFCPKDFQIQCSNDGSNWTTLLNVTGYTSWPTSDTFVDFSFSNSTPYQYIRLYITDTVGGNPAVTGNMPGVEELQAFEG